MSEEQEIFYEDKGEPVDDNAPTDAPKAAGGPWNVYWDSSTKVCCVAKKAIGKHHRFSPTTWQRAWGYITSRCELAGGTYQC